MHRRTLLVLSKWYLASSASLAALGCASTERDTSEHESIGSARMLADKSVQLRLRAERGVAVGDAVFVLVPGDARYTEVLQRIGGLVPGQEKPVPPWQGK